MWRDRVLADLRLPPLARVVGYWLADYVNRDTGEAWPSLTTLGERAGISKRYAVQMVQALVDAGLVEVVKATGRTSHYRIILAGTGEPQLTATEQEPVNHSSPVVVNPSSPVEPDRCTPVHRTGEPQFTRTLLKNPSDSLSSGKPTARRERKPPKPKSTAEPEGFAEWYAAYPRREARAAAARAYAKAVQAVPAAELLAGAKRYAAARAGQDPRYTAHPATWLNAGRWADEVPSAVATAPGAPAKPLHAVDRANRIRALLDRGEWATGWGPRRGEPGCLIPEDEWLAAERTRRPSVQSGVRAA